MTLKKLVLAALLALSLAACSGEARPALRGTAQPAGGVTTSLSGNTQQQGLSGLAQPVAAP